MKRFLWLLLLLPCLAIAQPHTVGTLSWDPLRSQPGYNLVFPHRQGAVYLTNACGEAVHHWYEPGYEPGEAAKLMPDGSIYIAYSRGNLSNPVIQGGGGGEKIMHLDWDGNLLWTYTLCDSQRRMHHDFEVLPNGNVIVIAWEWKTQAECLAAGRDPALLPVGHLLPDCLLELQPIGLDSAAVVWEWHAWDHLIQDYDSTRAHYGTVADHPERIDLNFAHPQSLDDWLHFNTVTWHPVLDMVMISCPVFNEIWVVDHSTTAAEAAGSTGGRSGRGGDLLFRWGNPQTYRRGSPAEKRLDFQHDTHWLYTDVGPGDPYFSGVGVFNNNFTANSSAAQVLTPVFDSLSWQFAMDSAGRYLPADFDWTYTTPDPAQMYSAVVSSMQRLPNGNTLILAGRKGYALEVNDAGDILWEYVVPYDLGQRVPQGATIPLSGNLTFRMKRYPPDFPAFSGRTLSPMGYLELNADTAFCDSLLAIRRDAPAPAYSCDLYPIPAQQVLYLRSTSPTPFPATIVNETGQQIWSGRVFGEMQIAVQDWPAGMYALRLPGGKGQRFSVLR